MTLESEIMNYLNTIGVEVVSLVDPGCFPVTSDKRVFAVFMPNESQSHV